MKAAASKGAGRPCLDGKKAMPTYSFRVTGKQREKLDKLGGGAWLREKIDAAKDPDRPRVGHKSLP